ncbi:NAD-dependent epimerase/dehydratase family protein [Litorihabitans aurantiacus]|uniref:Nucleoside-diphosphate sugar epimerase n=1 Tax=Litorihabitans aurantiacus TaxID=1930061 RepID=A0AA37XB68_9MICO|nr:NAD-dependent epimerase/dehydratase family protein [Litorihabitans aurantiacus]GMA30734.1 nucleoside-diphosphate sugar epimerase [Litorihabitans aurantiacus]
MRIVLVGATGNIGTALLRAAADRSSVTHVDAVSRRGAGRLTTPGPVAVAHHALDAAAPAGTEDAERLAELASGADAVVHLAWSSARSASRATAANVALSRGVLRAARGARQLVVGSCASVYSASYTQDARDEDWATDGLTGVALSQDKVGHEHLADEFERRHPGVVVTRVRPALVLQESAGAELARRHLGPLALGLGRAVPTLLWPEGLRLQVAHADDVAATFLAAIERRAPGAYNIASPQVLHAGDVAQAIGAHRTVTISPALAQTGHDVAWWTRTVRARPDWLDVLRAVPVLDSSRAHDLLGVRPRWDGSDVLRAAARGIADRREGWTPALSRRREPGPTHL